MVIDCITRFSSLRYIVRYPTMRHDKKTEDLPKTRFYSTQKVGNIKRASTSRSLVRIPISNESLYHATQKKNHGYSTSIAMPTTRALIRSGIDSDVDQHRGHVCSKAATTRGIV